MTRSIRFDVNGLAYLALGALVYWFNWGNPDVAGIIPFVAMLFFWPFFLLYKIWAFVAFWVMMLFLTVFVLGGGYLVYDHFSKKRARAARLKNRGF